MNLLYRIVAAVAAGGAVFLLWNAVMFVILRMRAPKVALAQADMAAQPSPFTRTGLRRRVEHFLAVRGYAGNVAPVALAGLLVIAVVSGALNILGISGILAVVGSVLGSIAAVWVASSILMGKRKASFDRQLLHAISMLVGQVESGTSVEKGIRIVAAASAEPLRSEFLRADATASATRDLPAALADVATRYPSRAMALFVTAIEMTSKQGSAVGPALRTASNILAKDFELQSEAQAEVAQSRYEYYAILGILAFIAWTMMFGNKATAEAFRTPIGIIVGLFGASWAGFGMFRISNMLRKAERGNDPPRPTKERKRGAPEPGTPGAPEVIR